MNHINEIETGKPLLKDKPASYVSTRPGALTEILAAIMESIKAEFNERYYSKDRAKLRERAIKAVGFDRQDDKEIIHAAR